MANDKNRGEQSRRMKASERRAASAGKSSNPFSTISARERRVRTGRQPVSLTSEPQAPKIDQTALTHLLAHPTKDVSEEELRKEYSYVVADLRSMGLLAASLMVLLVVLATLLPK